MTQFTIKASKDDSTPVIVDLSKVDTKAKGIGYQESESEADNRKQEAQEKADSAMNSAMTVIQQVAGKVTGTIEAMSSGDNDDLPLGKVEFGFGIRLNEDGEAIVAKSGSETHFSVKLTWGEDD